ncbi:MAG TPA: methyl-accepting chemotaxis protein [Solimonas sp.]|nr:methyl-accepting chemotaxis protein [Solimonas sp.]
MADKKVRGTRREFALLIISLLLIGVSVAGLVYIQRIENRDDTWEELARSISDDVVEVVKVGEEANRGVTPDFLTLSSRAEDLGATIKALAEGDADAGIVAAPGSVQEEVAAVAAAWSEMRTTVDTVLAGEQQFRRMATNAATIVSTIHAEGDEQRGKDLFGAYERIAESLGSRGGQNPAIGQLTRLERISGGAKNVIGAGRDAQATVTALDGELGDFAAANDRLLADGGVAALVKTASELYSPIAQLRPQLVEDAAAVDKLQTAAGQLQGAAANVIATAKALEQRFIDTRERQDKLPVVFTALLVIAAVLLGVFVVLFLRSQRRRIEVAEDRDARQQQAILSLLDEITNLADGDLTVDVTVTEDFTGAIADSINYTVANMRNLVGTITSTSTEIASAASNTQQTALRMSEASERQAREITAVTTVIGSTSQSMQQVAASAEKLAQQAQSSVEIAHSGAETVNRTIMGMSNLREQIQDTSKRIKRLGESSQEIGNIIEFINDIAEQTNTLALNASIQAAMAGEAGRGFAVVADEVQRLAERAANATRQIENLVKTIQADTNEAIISMERSTQNVVVGAKSAEEAGQALTKVENSSQELAKLITEISSSARNQSAQATKIAGTMQVIRDIAVQTSGSASQTAQAVGELTNLSEKLRESVAGFKLPEENVA